ncbi:hypothetical protein L9F63_005372, partial [Diploptera punctata]
LPIVQHLHPYFFTVVLFIIVCVLWMKLNPFVGFPLRRLIGYFYCFRVIIIIISMAWEAATSRMGMYVNYNFVKFYAKQYLCGCRLAITYESVYFQLNMKKKMIILLKMPNHEIQFEERKNTHYYLTTPPS